MWNNTQLLNRLSRALWVLTVLLLAAGGLAWVGTRTVFALHTVEVKAADEGALRHVNALSIRANVNGKFSGNFFSVDLGAVRDAFESVPWVRRASVRRVWPSGLEVVLEEHEALGTWGPLESAKLVNTYGEIFVANVAEAEEDGMLMAFQGPENSAADVLAKMETIGQWFRPLQLAPREVWLSDRYAWRAKLSNGMQVELGREQNEQDRAAMDGRVRRFVAAWPQVVAKWGKQIEYADLRYPNGFAIRAAGMRFLSESKTGAALPQ